jgi:hypothetical protein
MAAEGGLTEAIQSVTEANEDNQETEVLGKTASDKDKCGVTG